MATTEMNKMSEAALQYFQDLKLAEKDPVLLFSLAVALLAILIALRALRHSRFGGDVGAKRASYTVQELSVRLNDYIGRNSTTLTKLTEDFQRLDERLAKLDNDFGILAKTSLEEFKKNRERSTAKESPAEKKTELIDDLPVVVAKSVVTPPPAPIQSISREPSRSLNNGLEKTRRSLFGRLQNLIGRKDRVGDEFFADLEEILISSDLGIRTTSKLIGHLRETAHGAGLNELALRSSLKSDIQRILDQGGTAAISPRRVGGDPLVILVVGVNGVGKTTTIGKLAQTFSAEGAKVLLGACDTFRAAAVEQIAVWAERSNVQIVRGDANAKPSTVAYQTIHKARDEGFDVVIIDTAGRLHTRVNLMNELKSIVQIIEREQPGAPHETLLVLDATTGQNALQQAREFNEIARLTGIIVTKLDGTPKGGIVVAIKDELGIPIRYIGVGEGVLDLRPFSANDFVEALFADDGGATFQLDAANAPSERARARRQRRSDFETLPN